MSWFPAYMYLVPQHEYDTTVISGKVENTFLYFFSLFFTFL